MSVCAKVFFIISTLAIHTMKADNEMSPVLSIARGSPAHWTSQPPEPSDHLIQPDQTLLDPPPPPDPNPTRRTTQRPPSPSAAAALHPPQSPSISAAPHALHSDPTIRRHSRIIPFRSQSASPTAPAPVPVTPPSDPSQPFRFSARATGIRYGAAGGALSDAAISVTPPSAPPQTSRSSAQASRVRCGVAGGTVSDAASALPNAASSGPVHPLDRRLMHT
ncbi:hypothetical protein U9M48_008861, partial [Paspalum notatum var. saurae]